MKKYMEKMMALVKDEEGATAIEYGLMVAGIAAAIAATVFALGGSINQLFATIDTELIDAAESAIPTDL